MDNKLIAGVAVLVLVIAGGWYLLSSGTSPSGQPAAVAAAQTGSGTLGGLLAMGSVTCQVTIDEGNSMQGQGTVYVAGGKMSGDFSTMVASSTVVAHMINDGTNIYSWSDAIPQGVKMPASSAQSASSTPGSQEVSNATAANYSCVPWAGDESKFVPPQSVTFMDLGAMMPKAQ